MGPGWARPVGRLLGALDTRVTVRSTSVTVSASERCRGMATRLASNWRGVPDRPTQCTRKLPARDPVLPGSSLAMWVTMLKVIIGRV